MPEHECRRERDFLRINEEHSELMKKADSHVTWTIFWSIVILLVGIFGASVNSTNSSVKEIDENHVKQINSLEDKVNSAAITQAKIDAQLANINSQLADIQLKLAKIK